MAALVPDETSSETLGGLKPEVKNPDDSLYLYKVWPKSGSILWA